MTTEKQICIIYPTEGGWTHKYRSGTFVGPEIGAHPPSQLDRAARDLFLFACMLGPGDTVLDVGAGAGEEVRTFAEIVGPTGRVIAVEAQLATFSLLVRNCSSLGVQNVFPVHRAVTDRHGFVTLSHTGPSVGDRIVGASDTAPTPASSLDELASELDIRRVALLKMNIEGAEKLAIRGMDRIVESTDNVCISCHDFLVPLSGDESMKTKHLVRRFLAEKGFTVQTRDHDPRPWVRDYLYGCRRAP